MEFVPLVALGALVKKLVDFMKDLTNRSWNGVLTQLALWAAGVGAMLLFTQTNWAEGISVGGISAAELSVVSQVFVGLSVSSFGSVAGFDIPKALDPTVQTPIRSLIPGKGATVPVGEGTTGPRT